MWRRGADRDGYVANFVETEQILQANGLTASFVQVSFSSFLVFFFLCARLEPYRVDFLKSRTTCSPGYVDVQQLACTTGRSKNTFQGGIILFHG